MRLYPYAGVAGDFMVWNGANNIATYGLVEHRYPVLATSQVWVSVRVCSFPSNSSACRECGLKEHETSPFLSGAISEFSDMWNLLGHGFGPVINPWI